MNLYELIKKFIKQLYTFLIESTESLNIGLLKYSSVINT